MQINHISNSLHGHKRDKNQDGILVIEEANYSLFMIFDGLSSHNQSDKFIYEFKNYILNNYRDKINSDGEGLEKLIFEAHNAVRILPIDGLSTLTGIIIPRDKKAAKYFNIGDTRLYAIANEKLKQITIDDHISKFDNRITRCLGLNRLKENDCRLYNLEIKTDLLLCTDGFYDLMHENEDEYLFVFSNEDLNFVKKILNKMQEKINYDDASYILIRTKN